MVAGEGQWRILIRRSGLAGRCLAALCVLPLEVFRHRTYGSSQEKKIMTDVYTGAHLMHKATYDIWKGFLGLPLKPPHRSQLHLVVLLEFQGSL